MPWLPLRKALRVFRLNYVLHCRSGVGAAAAASFDLHPLLPNQGEGWNKKKGRGQQLFAMPKEDSIRKITHFRKTKKACNLDLFSSGGGGGKSWRWGRYCVGRLSSRRAGGGNDVVRCVSARLLAASYKPACLAIRWQSSAPPDHPVFICFGEFFVALTKLLNY